VAILAKLLLMSPPGLSNICCLCCMPQVAHVNASGYAFIVHPSIFLIHRPHAKSDAQGLYLAASSSQAKQQLPPAKLFHRKVAALRHLAVSQMRKGQFWPVLDAPSARCFRELPWWQDWARDMHVLDSL
jgi:hypothetical protein